MAVVDLAKQVGTAKGDLYVYNGSTLVRLPIGSDDQVLKADSAQAAGVKWAASGGGSSALTGARLTKSTDQTGIAGATEVKITWDGVAYDSNSFFDNANDTLVVPSGLAGVYWIWGVLAIEKSSTAVTYYGGFTINGTADVLYNASFGSRNDSQTFPTFPGAGQAVELAVGDAVHAHASIEGGSSTRTIRARSSFGMYLIGTV